MAERLGSKGATRYVRVLGLVDHDAEGRPLIQLERTRDGVLIVNKMATKH